MIKLVKRYIIGSITEGFYVLSRQQFQTIRIQGDARANSLYAQAPHGKDRILLPRGIVIGQDSTNGRTTEKLIPAIKNFIDPFNQYGIIIDKKSEIWIKNGSKLFRCIPI